MLSQAGVEDEQLGVSQPRLQLFDTSLQLLQQRVGERREGRARVLHGAASTADQQGVHVGRLVPLGGAGSRMLREDFLEDVEKRTRGRRVSVRTPCCVNTASCKAAYQSIHTRPLIMYLQNHTDQYRGCHVLISKLLEGDVNIRLLCQSCHC